MHNMARRYLTAAAVLAAASAAATPLSGRTAEQLYTVELAPGETQIVSGAEKLQLKKAGKNFIDITNHPNLAWSNGAKVKAAKAFPSVMAFSDTVNGLISSLDKANLESKLQTYSDFETRYYQSTTGVEAAEWLLSEVQSLVSDSGIVNATVEPFTHANFEQISIIAKIPGLSETTVIAGAHLDSVNGNEVQGRSPGADDNGSGTVTLLESLRVLLTDPAITAGEAVNSIEFHWYAGEEGGLLGSADVFDQYASDGKDVAAYLNQDMTGWAPEGEVGEFGIITDYVDTALTDFTRLVIDAYTTIPALDGTCGYACSDHASATAAGYPSTFIFEAHPDNTSPYIHTADDAYDTVSFDHILEHAKLVTGFVYELSFSAL
ncbi:leucyl aminopeptidase [Xylariomycetidae sp. FL2044]|nr:leucyl aminopeptidase [Xylariomycetidae sp. FL2044]